MVRHYKRKGNWEDPQVLKAALHDALHDVKNGASVRKAADDHSVNRETLRRHVMKCREDASYNYASYSQACQTRRIFFKEEEGQLANYFLHASRTGYPFSTKIGRKLAYEFAVREKKQIPPSWQKHEMAGKDWMTGFLQRNAAVSLRVPEATSLARVTSFNKENVKLFFDNLVQALEYHSFTPESIFNLDETGLSTSHKPRKVLAETGKRHASQVVSADRGENVTLCAIINALGNSVPPCLVFPRKRFQPGMLLGAPSGSLGLSNPSGWMTATLFMEVLKHFVKHTRCSPLNKVLLLLDNHESHLSLDAIDYCRANGIVLLTFPPHTTHKLQPLDKTVFGPLKTAYSYASSNWMRNNPGSRITIHLVAHILGEAYPKAFTVPNISSGFRSTGISPLNRDIFSEEDYMLAPDDSAQGFVGCQSNTTQSEHELQNHPLPSQQCLDTGNDCSQPLRMPSASRKLIFEGDHTEPINASSVPQTVEASSCQAPPGCESTREETRCIKRKGRAPGTSKIATDTPERNKLANKKMKMQVVMASNHQGQAVFSTSSRGRQCVVMAAAGACFASLKPVLDWTTRDLDLILRNGDSLYQKIASKQPDNVTGFLMIDDIPSTLSVFDKDFLIQHLNSEFGIWRPEAKKESEDTMKKQIIELLQKAPACVLLMKEAATVLIKPSSSESFNCCVFDSHARNEKGLSSARGKALLMKFPNPEALMQYLRSFIAKFDPVSFPYQLGPLQANPAPL